jgi:hypothetical protein
MSLVNFSKTVTTAGVAERLKPSEFKAEAAVIQAKSTNTGKIYVGGRGVLNNESDGGCYLEAGQCYNLPDSATRSVFNLSEVWINSETNGEGVNVNAWGIDQFE